MERFMEAWKALGARAAEVLNDRARRRAAGEPDPPVQRERFNFAEPPPGHYWDRKAPGYVRQGHGRLRLLADAWVRWKAKRDPPGMRVEPTDGGFVVVTVCACHGAPRQSVLVRGTLGEARAAAWEHYEDWLKGAAS